MLDSIGQSGAVIDEVQRVPQLLSYIQGIVDAKKVNGMFILTGSAQFELLESINQSLAGRNAIVRLLPFSTQELYKDKQVKIEDLLYSGFYPRIHDEKLNPTEALGFYVNAYIERDVRNILNVKDLSSFQNFLKLCAARAGQILNLTSLGNDCGINHNTAKSWLSVLEASYITFHLKPHYKKYSKRVVKSPKIYFYDVGLLSYLLVIEKPSQILTHPLRGNIFENFIISEIIKTRFNNVKEKNIYFYRDNTDKEVDVLVEKGGHTYPIKIKSSKTIASDFFKNLHFYKKLVGDEELKSYLIYAGKESYSHLGIQVLSFHDYKKLEEIVL